MQEAAKIFPDIIKPDWIPKVQAAHIDPDVDTDALSGMVKFQTAKDKQLALESDEHISPII